jgi:tetratricopeptide (TPR) repeat protein
MRGSRKLIVFVIAAALVTACVPPTKVKKPKKTSTKKTSQKTSRTAWKKAKIDKLLKKGDYREALLEISGAIKRGQKESVYHDSRARAINGLISRGQKLESSGKPGQAAKNYKTALDYYPKGAKGGIKKPAAFLKKRLGSIESSLMDEGLRKYRAGRLEEAVSMWDSLLAINPNHAQARKSRETAKTQLRNLKNLK